MSAYVGGIPNYTAGAPVGLYVSGYTQGEYVWYAGFGGSEDTVRVVPLWSGPQAIGDTGTLRLFGSAGGELDAGSAFEYNFGNLVRSLGAGRANRVVLLDRAIAGVVADRGGVAAGVGRGHLAARVTKASVSSSMSNGVRRPRRSAICLRRALPRPRSS